MVPAPPVRARPDPSRDSFGSGIQICQPPIPPVELTDPTTVSDCSQAGLQAALDAGGQIDFDCGPDPVSIPISTHLELSTTTDTVLDGGGLVTLDGQGLTCILHKGCHNPDTVNYNPDSNKRVHICGTDFENNTAERGGGATSVVVSDNKGIKATYERSSFTGNSVLGLDGSYGQGGAVYHIKDDHACGTGEDNLEIIADPGTTHPFTLTVTNPYTTLLASLAPTRIQPGESAHLTVTDTLSWNASLSALWYTLAISATSSDMTLTTQAGLIVGGVDVYLPVVAKGP
jgi:hypothetical protein